MNSQRQIRVDIISYWFAAIAALGLWYVGTAAQAASQDGAGVILVTDLRGEVSVTSGGNARRVAIGSALSLPASVRTGTDGSLELRQGTTTVAISANSMIDLPASLQSDGMLDRIAQSNGSVFYRVGNRESRKLRVETPYLVAVIKGTQFNVVVQPDSATVALFEGLLEVQSADGSDVVELNAGEIASRFGTEPRIRVLRMNTGETLRGQVPVQNPSTAGLVAALNVGDSGLPVAAVAAPGEAPGDVRIGGGMGTTSGTPGEAPVTVGGGLPGGSDSALGSTSLGTNVSASVGTTSLGVNANLSGSSLSLATDTGVAGLNATTNISAGNGGLSVDTSLAGISLGVDVGGSTTATVSTPALPVLDIPAVTVSTQPVTTIATTVITPLVTPVLTPTVAPALTPALTPAVEPIVTSLIPPVTVSPVSLPVPAPAPATTGGSNGGLLGGLTNTLGLP